MRPFAMNNKKLLVLPLLLSCFSPSTLAEKADREKPIEIHAATLFMDQLRGITIADGDVIATQGTLTVNASHVTVTRDPQGNQTLIATGEPTTFRQRADKDPQRNDNKEVWIEGQGQRLDYKTATHLAILTSNARVKKGDSIVIGDVITYNTDTEIIESRGGTPTTPNRGRVTVIIPPEEPNPESTRPESSKTERHDGH